MNIKSMLLACFIGGTLCCGVALLVIRQFWWLGLLAGGAGGFLGYEFRQTLVITWGVFRFIGRALARGWTVLTQRYNAVVNFPFKKTFLQVGFWPFPLASIIIVFGSSYWYFSFHPEDQSSRFIAPMMLSISFNFVTFGLCILGAETRKRYSRFLVWINHINSGHIGNSSMDNKRRVVNRIVELKEKGYQESPWTFYTAFSWMATGLAVILGIVMGIGIICCLFYLLGIIGGFMGLNPGNIESTGQQFLDTMIIGFMLLIFACGFVTALVTVAYHSYKICKFILSHGRIFCAICGMLGGSITYFFFTSTILTTTQQTVVSIFGGVLSMAIGYIIHQASSYFMSKK